MFGIVKGVFFFSNFSKSFSHISIEFVEKKTYLNALGVDLPWLNPKCVKSEMALSEKSMWFKFFKGQRNPGGTFWILFNFMSKVWSLSRPIKDS